ncbi:MAG: outer membrane beta-barrel protein [Bacteroidota bacterium]
MNANPLYTKTSSLLFALLLLFSVSSIAQSSRRSDTTEVAFKNKRIIIITDEDGKRVEVTEIVDEEAEYVDESQWEDDDNDDRDRGNEKKRRNRSQVNLLGLDFGLTNYYIHDTRAYGTAAVPNELAVKEFQPFSHVALHLLPTTVSIAGKGAVNLKTAITVDWNNYNYTNDVTLINAPEGLLTDTSAISFDKNKLVARYLQIPLMLNINTAPGTNDGLSVSFGPYVGVLWKAFTKQVSEDRKKIKEIGDFGLNDIRYGFMARFDLKWFDIYAMYNLSDLFAENQGPQTQTFMAGINVINF